MQKNISRPHLVILISGSGTNLQAILEACREGIIEAEPVLVVSNKGDAYGLTRAKAAGVSTIHFPYAPYKTDGREAYDAGLAGVVAAYQPDLIILAGWMRILTPAFLNRFPRQVINLHPALPGQFDGLNGIERAFAAYKRGDIDHSGCMVHYAIPEVDAGPVIATELVPFEPNDTLDRFATRLHAAEHRLIVKAVNMALKTSPL